MQRFFFHIDYGETSRDTVGTPLADLKEARAAAVTMLGELLRDEADGFWDKPSISITVTDADGLVLWTLQTFGLQAPSVSVARG